MNVFYDLYQSWLARPDLCHVLCQLPAGLIFKLTFLVAVISQVMADVKYLLL